MKQANGITASQAVLLAAADLRASGLEEFSEWDLTVRVWQRDPNKFGCRGYEQSYPDHKRVMMEIMAQSKSDNPIRKGWLERTRPNHYRITALGLTQANFLAAKGGSTSETTKSEALIYDEIYPYAGHRIFRDYRSDGKLPKMWLSVEAFYGITRLEPGHVRDRINRFVNSVRAAQEVLASAKDEALQRGPSGGGRPITSDDLDKLLLMHKELATAFSRQFASIERR